MGFVSEAVDGLLPSEVVRDLVSLITRPTVAVIAAVPDTRTVHEWSDGVAIPDRQRLHVLRVTLEAARILQHICGPSMIFAWFTGMNSHLRDAAPAEVLREAVTTGSDPAPVVIGAARAFVNQF
jgi:hypothetical protein